MDQELKEQIAKVRERMEITIMGALPPLRVFNKQKIQIQTADDTIELSQQRTIELFQYFIQYEPKLLFTQFIDLDTKKYKVNDNSSNSPLHHVFDSPQKLELVIKHFAKNGSPININMGKSDGKTALSLACEYGYSDSVSYLLKQGADPTITYDKGLNLVHYIAKEFKARDKEGQLQSIELLAEKGVLKTLSESKDQAGKTYLDYLDGSALSMLLIDKVNSEIKVIPAYIPEWVNDATTATQSNVNPLSILPNKEDGVRRLRFLLRNRPDLILPPHENLSNNEPQSLLDSALAIPQTIMNYIWPSSNNQINLNDYNINALDATGNAPIHYICTSLDMLKSFINITKAAGLEQNINITNNRGETVLLHAAQYGEVKAVKYLIEKESNLKTITDNKQNILHIINSNKNYSQGQRKEIEDIIKTRDPNLFQELSKAMDNNLKIPNDYLNKSKLNRSQSLPNLDKNSQLIKKHVENLQRRRASAANDPTGHLSR